MGDGTPHGSHDGLRFELLGPLRALRDGVEIPLGPPKQRAVLAVLLLQEGRPISYDGLVEAVWGGAPPAHVRNLVQKYVSGLRRALGDAGGTGVDGQRIPADRRGRRRPAGAATVGGRGAGGTGRRGAAARG